MLDSYRCLLVACVAALLALCGLAAASLCGLRLRRAAAAPGVALRPGGRSRCSRRRRAAPHTPTRAAMATYAGNDERAYERDVDGGGGAQADEPCGQAGRSCGAAGCQRAAGEWPQRR